MQQYTPMIQQYLRIKAQYQDAFLFFRLGDFYELFFEDAIKAAKELEITLTKRDGGTDEPVPMCGVPHHSAEMYIAQLIEKGYKVAICEQMEDPKQAKGVVKREVVQVITPGTVMSQSMMDEKQNNFIAAVTPFSRVQFGAAISDLSTGENYLTMVNDGFEELIHVLSGMNVKEVIVASDFPKKEEQELKKIFQAAISYEDETSIPEKFRNVIRHLSKEQEIATFGRLLNYLLKTQKRALEHLQPVEILNQADYMKIDLYSKRNLELVDTIRKKGRKGSLVWLLDQTVTAMGGRLLTKWIERPLVDRKQIEKRLDIVECLSEQFLLREELKELLKGVYDIERLAGKISYGNVNAKDLVQLKKTLEVLPQMIQLCHEFRHPSLTEYAERMPVPGRLADKLNRALVENPPTSIKEGGMIRDGYNEQLDEYREISINGREWIKNLEQKEREKTGIKSLKIGFNRVFGYYIEVTKANLHLLKEGKYERKQTLANAERFVTPELKEMEMKILHAEEMLADLEYELFLELREEAKAHIPQLQMIAKLISEIDVLQSFAAVSAENRYVKPEFNKEGIVAIKDGRHPVVEQMLTEQSFVENDIFLDQEKQMLLITGPNMSGKSTYMRQLALIAIMSQIGCFVPAAKANLPIFDQVFTRIGAADDLVSGQSTFMVEMLETRYAVMNATKDSLILLDEIGRGTSTYDGMALAHAIIEYIHDEIGAKTLFSTHYHELTALEEQLPRLQNVHVKAVEENGRVVFLHKVHEGAADESYGIHVAQLANLPEKLISRAKVILQQLEEENQQNEPSFGAGEQLSFFIMDNEVEKPSKVDKTIAREIASLNLLNMTPIEAMNVLHQLQEKVTSGLNKR